MNDQSEKKVKKLTEIRVKLENPIEWGDETISELILRKPKAKDIEHLTSEPTFKDLFKVAQRCAKVPRRVIEDLDSDDAIKVVEAVGDFLDGGQ